MVDLTANLITSLITGENCLYESIKESDERLDLLHKKIKKKDKASDTEEEPLLEQAKERKNEKTSEANVKFNNVLDIIEDNGIKFTKFQPASNSNSLKKNKSFSLNFKEYCQHENEESFHFIRKIIKKTQLSLTTFIVGLYFIYSYKHLEKDKRKHREQKVSRYLSDWPSPTTRKSNKKKKRRRKNKNKNSENLDTDSGSVNKKESNTSQNLKEKVSKDNDNINNENNNIYSSEDNPSPSASSSDIEQNSKSSLNSDIQNKENSTEESPILKPEFLSSFQPRNSSSLINSSNSSIKSNNEPIMNQHSFPSHSKYDGKYSFVYIYIYIYFFLINIILY